MTRQTRVRAAISLIGALLLLAGLMAQFGDSSARAKEMAAHPAHIHTGLCPTPGDVVFPLTDVSAAMSSNGTVTAESSEAGAASAIPVEGSVTTVKSALKDLVDGNHAIVVHESMANIGNYIACGDIGGMMMGESDLAIGLGSLNNSGESGVAQLHDNGDGSTTVTIFLVSTGMQRGSEGATPAATAASSTAGTAVEIKDFAYDQASIEIPVGTTVTWTNNDSVPHTVTQNGGGFASKAMNPGDTFSFTFDKAGTYNYHCEYHANMMGTVVVK